MPGAPSSFLLLLVRHLLLLAMHLFLVASEEKSLHEILAASTKSCEAGGLRDRPAHVGATRLSDNSLNTATVGIIPNRQTQQEEHGVQTNQTSKYN